MEVAAAEKGTAFRRTSRSDLNWIFTVQTEREVEKDNTVAIRDQRWQIDKTRFRSTLAGSTVTIHEHLDATVSIRYGPHVVGRYSSTGEKPNNAPPKERRGKGGSMEAGENQKQVSTGFHTPLEISPKTRDSHFPTAPTTALVLSKRKAKAKPKTKRRRPKGRIALFHKADRSLIIKTGQLDVLPTQKRIRGSKIP